MSYGGSHDQSGDVSVFDDAYKHAAAYKAS